MTNFFAGRTLEAPDNEFSQYKLRILLLVADFASHAKFVFSWPA